MFKKNTRKRLLAGALATVMMLTMCPSWALADDEDIAAPLPLVDENRPVAESAPVEADTTKTPADSTPSAPEAKPAEGQDPAPAPSDGGANGGTDSTEAGNSTNPTIPEGSGNISQKNDVVSNSPANTTSLQEPLIDLTWLQPPKKENIKYFVLLPKRGKPQNGANQLPKNYLPNETSDGGVAGCNNVTGYIGGDLTQDGKDIADDNYSKNDAINGYTKTEGDGVEGKYLIPPTDLGFFDEDHWEDNGTYTGHGDPATILGKDFNGKDIKIVWYTIKHLDDGYHIDGYVKNVAINVTYHSNFGEDKTFTAPTETGTYYEALSYADTRLSARENYTFAGWYTDMDCTEAYEPATLMTSLDLYAKWEPIKYKVTWKNSDNAVDSLDTQAVNYNGYPTKNPSDKASKPSDDQYTYEFAGWKLENTEDTKLVNPNTTPVTENVTYVAVFTPVAREYTVTYKVDGVETKSTKHAFNTPVQIEPEPTKTGHTFSGWSSKNVTLDGTSFTMPAKNVVIEGTFTANEYTVTYKVDGVETKSTKHAFNTPVQIEPEPTKTGHTFSGWSSKNVTLGDTSFTMPAKDVVIEGKFTANEYKVTYYVDDKIYTINGEEQVFTRHYGDNVTLAAKPTRDGFNFNGWVPEGVSFNATGTGFQMPANNVVIRGTFDANSFYVAYYVDGIPFASDLYKTGAKVTIRSDLAKDGHTFSGWTSDDSAFNIKGFEMPAHNVEIHGSYSQNTHKYTINKHFYDEKGVEIAELASTTPDSGAENAPIANLYKKDAVNQTVDGKNYVYVSGLTKVTPNLEGGTLTEDVTIDLYYYLDVKGGEKPGEIGNGTPDAWEHRLTFKVVNGEWNDGGNADIVVYVQSMNNQTGKPLENVWVPLTRIPFVGEKPNSGYHAGAWDTSPYDNYKVQKDTVFTYTYAKNSSGGSSGGSHHRKPTVTIPDKVPTGLNGNDHYAYIVGYPDKTVRPQNGITRAEVATIFFRLLTDETRNANSTKSNSYSDVAAGAWYNHAVSTLSAMGIVKGDSNGKFNPNAPITRAEFAAIAARFDDKANSTTADFSDIVSHWAKNEISAASNNGWINGYPDGTFRPDNKITRAEAMTLVNRVLKRLPETAEDLHDDMIKWSDNSDASQWFYLAVQEATNSHYYKAKENKSEKWTELRDTRDWTELEK